ncbi:MAG TPA: sodium:solute symporter [Saprospiraceae bacterium]|nr:sodium:solute symporter [Saprospiraceae bacterium]
MGLALVDWVVLFGTIMFIIFYGIYKTRGAQNINDYIKGGEGIKWFTVGLSVMATQASAITFMSTPGQAYHDGLGFVQFYFGLPLAMVVISIFFLPIYQSSKIITAYEYLESRFNNNTRLFTAVLFLIQRGLGAGITIFAPSIILSTILGWDLNTLNIIIGTIVIIYTMSGGTKAVSITHRQQMTVIFLGLILAFIIIFMKLPADISFSKAYDLASTAGKTKIINYSFNFEDRYTLWSGLTGGFFLALAYFGTDQIQVQRYLSAHNEKQSRLGLIMNGVLKVPLQFFILFVGLMVFVFFQFNKPPLFFNTQTYSALKESSSTEDVLKLENNYNQIFEQKLVAIQSNGDKEVIKDLISKENEVRSEFKELIKSTFPKKETNDKDYVFIYFILNYLPKGIIGLLLAMILSAAMSSTASELNALASTTTLDIFKRNFQPSLTEHQYVKYAKLFTVLWGIIAILFACVATLFENLIQFVNIVGSLFYGTILGVFLVGFFMKFVKGRAVFWSAILAEISVILIFKYTNIGYLWLNFVGVVIVMLLSVLLQNFLRDKETNI